MSTKNELKADDTLNQFKVVTAVQQVEIIEKAVDVILISLKAIDEGKAAARAATLDGNNAAKNAESKQLAGLRESLAEISEPITEISWEKLFRANVAAKLDDSRRYTSTNSRDVMVNMLKVATMGLTLAKKDRQFDPSYAAQSSLKKYADEVRPKLQKAIDPATGKPRLRSIATMPKPPKRLPQGAYYWLVGCEDAEKGLEGANAVIGAGFDLEQLRKKIKRLSGRYASFYYCASKFEPINLDAEEEEELPIQNSAVLTATLSPSSKSLSTSASGREG